MSFPEGRDGDIQACLALARAVASPAYPFEETITREWAGREADSGPRDTAAQSRQAGASWHGPKLRAAATGAGLTGTAGAGRVWLTAGRAHDLPGSGGG